MGDPPPRDLFATRPKTNNTLRPYDCDSRLVPQSSPLAGLILVDPLLLPEDGRATTTGSRKEKGKKTYHSGGGMASSRWRTSLTNLISMMEGGEKAPPPLLGASGIDPLLLFPVNDGTSFATTQQSSTVGGGKSHSCARCWQGRRAEERVRLGSSPDLFPSLSYTAGWTTRMPIDIGFARSTRRRSTPAVVEGTTSSRCRC